MPGPENSHPDLQRGVLVVGAGPVGLTLACELERRGVAVRVIDQEDGPTPPSQSRVSHLERYLQRVLQIRVGASFT